MRFTPRRVTIVVLSLLFIGAIVSSISVGFTYGMPRRERKAAAVPIDEYSLEQRRDAVKEAFTFAWDGYEKYCMGHDTLHPVDNTCADDFGGWGVSAIDALSTAIIMELKPVVISILHWIVDDLDFNVVVGGTQVQFFEVVIRHFGGMISAYDLLTGPFPTLIKDDKLLKGLYGKMVELGDILSLAFTSPAGIPHDWVSPSGVTDDGLSVVLSTLGSNILEFARLSDITGNRTYVALARRSESYGISPKPYDAEPFPGLLGNQVNLLNGDFGNSQGSWGALSDSFYEYLLKAYLYNADMYSSYLDRWLVAVDSTIRFLNSHPYGRPDWQLLPYWQDDMLINYMETLSWFAGGNFILGGMVTKNETITDFGLNIADTAGKLYASTITGLGPEYVAWTETCDSDWVEQPCDAESSIHITDARYQLRPEVLETWYYAYRATNDSMYQDFAWKAFIAINETCRASSGFSSIQDVTEVGGGEMTNVQESFVYAEVLKYLYLIHLTDPDADFQVQDSSVEGGRKNTWVFNTEAHPFKVKGPPV
ncbi:glycoside hydrolase family 47 protein [Polychaeton citri CBS 116435]|uniref:alpha-1,2-Mannosidase n=1 Tax=Polychaeton citri CBS 116435 TaxID=1314669 RepID=A0A9P4UQP0_9PEZI|nr:glycoside hydrolase family 47 protein [Polychaeton citri CBS 116435]